MTSGAELVQSGQVSDSGQNSSRETQGLRHLDGHKGW
jgi:hypothetical protein